ncbi:Ion transport peptide-like [Halotydeus destructor]|nr:Ion transport peptide-like [Halotydeus destructor]
MSRHLAALIALSVLVVLAQRSVDCRDLHRRTFNSLGCGGVYDKAKFARLDRVCTECYQMYREPELHPMCRQDCFRNEVFARCVDALLLNSEQMSLQEMVSDVYGRRK